ncbi:hypothetical protein F5Y01DRAFT_319091 [Xylaria sp. FL0043]|nr:hypothetical protein F5Y01DRAFT_319091 [Xylaria sp. FL0043]
MSANSDTTPQARSALGNDRRGGVGEDRAAADFDSQNSEWPFTGIKSEGLTDSLNLYSSFSSQQTSLNDTSISLKEDTAVTQDRRRIRDVLYPSFVQHTFRSRAGLSNLQLSHDAPVSICALDIATSHLWRCMPGHARRYVHLAAPNGPALWGDDNDAVVAMYKKLDYQEYHVAVLEEPSREEYKFFADLKRRPWVIWPLWIEDKWGSDYVTVIWYSENTPTAPALYDQLISYSIIDPRRSQESDHKGRHRPIASRIERIQNHLHEFWDQAGFNLTTAECKEVLCSPMPFNEATSGERCFAVVKDLIDQVIDWYTSGMKFCKVGTITNLKRWVNPFQQRIEMTGINAWTLMASLEYNARISVEAISPDTVTEIAADGIKKYVRPYDLASPVDEPPLAALDYFLPPNEICATTLFDTV